jgi:hypothetical protein
MVQDPLSRPARGNHSKGKRLFLYQRRFLGPVSKGSFAKAPNRASQAKANGFPFAKAGRDGDQPIVAPYPADRRVATNRSSRRSQPIVAW